MIEGLWTIEIKLKTGELLTSGVIVLFDGRVLGGDTRYFYVGTYKLDSTGRAYAIVTITHYSGPQESILLGNNKEYTLNLSGRPEQPVFDLDDDNVSAQLTFRAPIQLA
jgi:T3SS negative regulator,GrlR